MKRLTTNLLMLLLGMLSMQLYAVELNSIYPMKPNDPEAFYFTPENYPIKADGKMDVSDALQAAINQVKLSLIHILALCICLLNSLI